MILILLSYFAVGFLLPIVARIVALRRERRLAVTLTVPDGASPATVAGYFAEIAARLDATPVKMRVAVVSPPGVSLDVCADGRLQVNVSGQRPQKVDLRRRWIADHPVPLALGGARPTVLFVDPVDANRFRVNNRLPIRVPMSYYVCVGLVTTLAVVFMRPALVAAALGTATALAFLQRWSARSG